MDALLRDTALLSAYLEDTSDESNIVSYLGDPYEESGFKDAVDSALGKVSAAIKKIIEKIKEMYKNLKEKAELAKIKAVLNMKGAKSSIMIKFKFHDKDITKYVNQVIKLENKFVIDLKKIENDFLKGRINSEEAGDRIEEYTEEFLNTFDQINNQWDSQIAQAKIGDAETSYTAVKINEYLQKLTKYQEGVILASEKNVVAEEERLYKEAQELEKLSIKQKQEEEAAAKEAAKISKKEKAGVKARMAAALAKVNKKAMAVILSIIALASAVGLFKSGVLSGGTQQAATEGADDIDDIFNDLSDFSESWDDYSDGYDPSLEDLFEYI
jgi:hypothetical protein